MKLKLYHFDTWGNEDDGYDVNGWFLVDTQTVSDDFCDDDIDYKKVRDIFEIKEHVYIEYDGGNNVELFDEENGKPLGTIEMVN